MYEADSVVSNRLGQKTGRAFAIKTHQTDGKLLRFTANCIIITFASNVKEAVKQYKSI